MRFVTKTFLLIAASFLLACSGGGGEGAGESGGSTGGDTTKPIPTDTAAEFVDERSFDAGSKDFIQTDIDLQNSGSYSVSTWIKVPAATKDDPQHILWQGSGATNGWGAGTTFNTSNHEMHLSLNYFNACASGISVYFGGTDAFNNADCTDRADNAYVSDADSLVEDQWIHIAVNVKDPDTALVTVELYVNGSLKGSDTGTEVDRSAWDTDLRIARPGQDQRYFTGDVYGLRFYDRVLTANEIQALSEESF